MYESWSGRIVTTIEHCKGMLELEVSGGKKKESMWTQKNLFTPSTRKKNEVMFKKVKKKGNVQGHRNL